MFKNLHMKCKLVSSYYHFYCMLKAGLDANQVCRVVTLLLSSADAQPTDAEREVWDQVDVVLKDAKGILDELQAYKGAGVEIREVHLSDIYSQDGHRCVPVYQCFNDVIVLTFLVSRVPVKKNKTKLK